MELFVNKSKRSERQAIPMSETEGRVLDLPEASFRFIKNSIDPVKMNLSNSPLRWDPKAVATI
jgi:hypothetical protein